MAFTQLTDDLNIVQALDDEPNDVGGLSAQQLKAKFDEAPNLIKAYLNNVFLAELGGDDGAPNVGVTAIPEMPGVTNVQDALTGIILMLQDVTQGAVADGSITTAKLANLAATTEKLADACVTTNKVAADAVTTAKIAGLAVTAAKLAADAVETAKIKDLAVTTEKVASKAVTSDKMADLTITTQKLAEGAVATSKLGNGAVTEAKIANGAVSAGKIATGSVTGAKIAANAVSTIYTATIGTTWTGSAAPYYQDITINGLLAADKPIIDIVPSDTFATAEAQLEAWSAVYRMTASANKLRVYATEKTTTAVPIQILCVRK